MLTYILRRLVQNIVLLFIVAGIVFFMLYLTGDPVTLLLSSTATPQEVAELKERLGFNQPLLTQFFIFLKGIFTGNLGASLRYQQPVMQMVMQALPATILLAGTAMMISVFFGVLLGVGAAVKRGGFIELLNLTLGMIGQAFPVFWLGMLLILLFSVKLKLFPVSGYGTFMHLILPALTLGLYSAGRITRIVRSEMIEMLSKNYIQVARAKGLSEWAVVYKHALRAAAITIVTLVGLEFNVMLGGAVVTETVFSWPGIGRLLVQAAIMRDFPVTRGSILVICTLFLLVNLLVDILYCLLDRRIRY